jgi:hypothetical protein
MNTEEVRIEAINRFKQGKEIYSGEKYKTVEIDDSYPSIVYKNISKWSKFIFVPYADSVE